MKKRKIFIVAFWIIWLILTSYLISSINFSEYNKRNPGEKDRLFQPYPHIVEWKSDKLTLNDFTNPILFHDGDNISFTFYKGQYFIHHVSDTKYDIRIKNETGITLYFANSNTESDYCALGGGTITVYNDEIYNICINGNCIIALGNQTISDSIRQNNRFVGKTPKESFSFTFIPTAPIVDQIDYTYIRLYIQDARYNVTIFDHYFNVVEKMSNVDERTTLLFNDYESDRNFVFIEYEGDSKGMEISIDNKFQSNKSYEYTNVSIIIILTVIVIGITLKMKHAE